MVTLQVWGSFIQLNIIDGFPNTLSLHCEAGWLIGGNELESRRAGLNADNACRLLTTNASALGGWVSFQSTHLDEAVISWQLTRDGTSNDVFLHPDENVLSR